jgi:hypothetical protein
LANSRSRAGHDSGLSRKAEHARQCQRDRPAWQVSTHTRSLPRVGRVPQALLANGARCFTLTQAHE